MCNAQTIAWFDENLTAAEVRGARILDVGSRDVNGSVRPTLKAKGAREYIGIDIEAGPGVDLVCDICSPGILPPEPFDIVVSSSCLEHVENLRAAVANMKRACRPGGLIVIAVPAVWPRHDYPADYWRIPWPTLAALFADCEPLLARELPIRPGRMLTFGKFRKPGNFREIVEPLTLRLSNAV